MNEKVLDIIKFSAEGKETLLSIAYKLSKHPVIATMDHKNIILKNKNSNKIAFDEKSRNIMDGFQQ